jgi:hypothetical protein
LVKSYRGDPVGGVILHEEHDTGSVFCPREQEQIIGAEIEHWRQRTKTGQTSAENLNPGAESATF